MSRAGDTFRRIEKIEQLTNENAALACELRKLRAERDTLMNVVEMLSRYDALDNPFFYSVINKAKAAVHAFRK